MQIHSGHVHHPVTRAARWSARWLVLWLAPLSAWAVPAEAPPAAATVVIETGTVAGTQTQDVRKFLGLPYAAAPTGERRWRNPAPAQPWPDVRDATQAGAGCPQPENPVRGLGPDRQDEDCLFLNVWSPTNAQALPVMVWIHGGAHRMGAGTLPFYDGTALARRGVVLVTINYRLGYLGYFSHPALAGEGEGGNFGLADQIAALQWVQRNIAGFGGDPQRVTVFGESAGGASVLQLMALPQAHGLFAAAIVQSGGGWAQPATQDTLQRQVRTALAGGGVAASADAAALRGLPAHTLVRAQAGDRALGFGPFLDGISVTRPAWSAFREGRQAQVPLLIGSNTWEGSLMQAMDIGEHGRRLAESTAVRDLYRRETDDDAIRQGLVFGDLVFVAPARWTAAAHARKAPAWLYRFGYVRSARRGTVPGVAHAGEIPYVFDTLGRSGGGALLAEMSASDLKMAADMADCWVAFARDGIPACGLGAWDAYSRSRDNTLDIGNEGAMQVERLRARILDAADRFFAPDARRR